MKHVLLTGAGGFIGSHVLEHILINTDWVVTATDSFRHIGISDRVMAVLCAQTTRDEAAKRLHVVTHDLTTPWSQVLIYQMQHNVNLYAPKLHYGPVDYIFNVASESHVDRSIEDPGHFARNNVALMLEMLELARQIKPAAFIHLSTDEVYGAEPLGRPSREWDPILPSNPYSASKAAQEAFGIAYWRTYDVPLVIANCMNIFGERQHPEKFIPKVMRQILAGETVNIYANEGAPGRRHWLHARNLADALVALTRRTPQAYGQVEFPDRYNITSPIEVNNLEMAELISIAMDRTFEYRLVDATTLRPGHDSHYALDGGKMRRLGWEPPVPFSASLKRTVQWTLEHPEWLLEAAHV